MIYLDSSVLVAAAETSERLHREARKAIERHEREDELAVDTIIAAEVYIALSRKSAEGAGALISRLLESYRYVEVPKTVLLSALPQARAYGFGDAVIEAHVRFDRARLLTCDREMARRLGPSATLVS